MRDPFDPFPLGYAVCDGCDGLGVVEGGFCTLCNGEDSVILCEPEPPANGSSVEHP